MPATPDFVSAMSHIHTTKRAPQAIRGALMPTRAAQSTLAAMGITMMAREITIRYKLPRIQEMRFGIETWPPVKIHQSRIYNIIVSFVEMNLIIIQTKNMFCVFPVYER